MSEPDVRREIMSFLPVYSDFAWVRIRSYNQGIGQLVSGLRIAAQAPAIAIIDQRNRYWDVVAGQEMRYLLDQRGWTTYVVYLTAERSKAMEQYLRIVHRSDPNVYTLKVRVGWQRSLLVAMSDVLSPPRPAPLTQPYLVPLLSTN